MSILGLCYNLNMLSNFNFKDYQLLDAGDKEKLESWKGIILRRPDPMAIWPKLHPELWSNVDAVYHRSTSGGGRWEYIKPLKDHWTIKFNDLAFKVSPTNFKHTGLFPEQAYNWQFVYDKIQNSGRNDIKILNLFAYTGAATMAASKAGAQEVVHVDAAKGMIEWAKENMHINHLDDKVIRYIVDDCLKFMRREIKRGHKYDGIIMDPPSYGRGPNNELFKFEDKINTLIETASELLSDNALFLIVNSYTTGYSSTVMENILNAHFKDRGGKIISDELGIPITNSETFLPCGLTSRWEND